MKLRKFIAADARQAMQLVKNTLGDNAVIISNKKHPDGVEIIATDSADYEREIGVSTKANVNTNASSKITQEEVSLTAVDNSKNIINSSDKLAKSSNLVEAIDDPLLQAIKREIGIVNTLLKEQLFGLSWKDYSQKEPICAGLIRRLVDLGINPKIANKIINKLSIPNEINYAWQIVKDYLNESIIIDSDSFKEPGRYVLWGNSGVGKTSIIAKITALLTLKNMPDDIGLISTDSVKIGAYDELKIYGRIFSVATKYAETEVELKKHLNDFKQKKYIFIDTASIGQNQHRALQQIEYIKMINDAKHIPILSATENYYNHVALLEKLTDLDIDSIIISKVDESTSLGEIISILLEYNLKLKYISEGTEIPDDFLKPTKEKFVDLVFNVASKYRTELSEELLASTFRGMVPNV